MQRGFQRLDGLLCLSFDARRLFGFFGSDTLLLFEFDLRRLHLGAQVFRLLHHRGIVVVDIVQQIPACGEFLERRGSQDDVERRGLAAAIHTARPLAQLVLQLGDLGVRFVDARLGVGNGLDGRFVLVERFVIVLAGDGQLLLHLVDASANGIGLGELVCGRGLGKSERRPQQRGRTQGSRAKYKRAAIEAAREISHAKPPRIRRVCLMLDSHARVLTIRHRSEQRIRNNYSTTG